MILIGLTGSIAMGKSEAAKILAKAGLPVFDADVEVHKLYDSAEGAKLIAAFAPKAVLNGRVDRTVLTRLALRDKDLLSRLEPVVHEAIRQRRQDFIAQQRAKSAKAVVLDIPLLFETGSEKIMDKTLVISSTPERQRARALARPGMTPQRLAMILERQMPDDQKRARANVVIDNNGTLAELEKSLLALLQKWGLVNP
jgi:dephospho-CoA kinase